MIFCFSGTGNSRYIARRFAEALKDTVVDLNAKIKAQDNSLIQTGKDVIIVVPTYAWRIPRVVSKYNRHLAEQMKLRYMGTAQVVMPENYIAMFGVPEAEEAVKIVEKANPDIEAAIASIKVGQEFSAPRNNMYDHIMSELVNPIFYQLIVKADSFYASEICIGCGQCALKCPLNNVQLRNGKPVWGKKCTHCMACICYCPTKAIEYGKKSRGKPRYCFEKLELK